MQANQRHSKQETQDATCDIAIVGGGMVGAALACALGGSRLRVVLVDAGPEPEPPAGGEYDLRVSAVTRASERIFRALGAWEGMVSRRVAPYREMHVWDAVGGSGGIHFDCAELGEDNLGHIIENRVIRAALLERLREHGNVERRFGTPLTGLRRLDGEAVLRTGGGEIRARLVVGADGARSWVRDQAGVAVEGWDYGHTAIVATVQTVEPHGETARQRFLPEGPLAFLPLGEPHTSSIVWSTGHAHAEALLALDEGEFRAELEHAFGYAPGAVTRAGPRAGFPLRMRHAEHYVVERVALVGDAAHTIHPLAGQGVNLGLLDAAALAEVLLAGTAAGRDPGGLATLRRYERWRRGDNLLMIAAMEGFKRLFAGSLPPLAWARNLGLEITDRLPPLKALFMRHALGLGGDLPRLARGLPPGEAA